MFSMKEMKRNGYVFGFMNELLENHLIFFLSSSSLCVPSGTWQESGICIENLEIRLAVTFDSAFFLHLFEHSLFVISVLIRYWDRA